MNAAEIREKFLSFFASKGHTVVASSPLVPGNDPTLLFTNSGMVQFKDVFTGKEHKPYKRAASAQRCVRAGGKHNDLENVGYTARHHTFFEMLGNFSFGDYFKQDAILYAWELLTQVYGLPAEKLYVTVYQEDDEAYNIWHQSVGVPPERIIRIGDNKGARYASDNFWQMADTGPCGPCSEIFYDHGPEVWGGPPGSAQEDGDRFIEIWNLVFMQFERTADGVLHPLPKPCVDTGMGLERIAAVLQQVHSNYEIDLFQALIEAAHHQISLQAPGVDAKNNSLKVIADHIRACAFLMVDGVIPSNEGRGYVLRRIIRRAIRHGYKLGCRKPFFGALVPALLGQMGNAYPELNAAAASVQQLLQTEEERFFETLEHGMDILNKAIEALPKGSAFPGELAFKLHDTYGFPLDLTADVCRENEVAVDEAAFDEAMNQQRLKARAAGKFKAGVALNYAGPDTIFVGYDASALTQNPTVAKVLALFVDGLSVNQVLPGQQAVVVLDKSPFYAESGGQVGDAGVLCDDNSTQAMNHLLFQVEDTQKISPSVWGHHGTAVKPLALGQLILAKVETDTRRAIMRNHSATHLLHKALQLVLGSHVAQKGSLVDEHKTRFDFAHHSPVSAEQLFDIERWVNAQIVQNTPTQARVMLLDDAKQVGATMLFGEKYGDEVRVLNIGDSCELCGGTHVERTGDIGFFKIMSETGVAAGVRRIEATTGLNAWQQVVLMQQQLHHLAGTMRVPVSELLSKIEQTTESFKQAERELEQLKSKLAVHQSEALLSKAVEVQGIKVLAVEVPNVDAKQLREMADKLRDQLKVCVLLLATQTDDKVAFIAAVSKPLCERLKAGDLAKLVANHLGGSGGGKPDMAQGGGSLADQLPAALSSVVTWVMAMH